MTAKEQISGKREALQKAFDDEDFVMRIIQGMGSIDEVSMKWNFATVFSYYFASEDLNHFYTLNEINEKMKKMTREGLDIDQRYYFQAYNGCCEKTYNKNGLDDVSGLSPKVKEAMEILESELGKTEMILAGEESEIRRTFVTTDFRMLMRYALDYSPERLWKGPLKQDSPLPIRIGESKSDYMMRIIEGKLDGKTEKERKKIMRAGKIIADAYCTKRPRIAIIPENEIKDFKADCDNNLPKPNKKKPETTLYELAEQDNAKWTFNFHSGNGFRSEGGVVLYDKVTPDKFVTMSIPDTYELLQTYAVQRGANFGDMIDPTFGRIIERAQQKSLAVQKPQNVFSRFLSKLKLVKTHSEVETPSELTTKQYEDMRKN